MSVLIEHPRAIENIDEILAVEGLGGAIAVPLDLAVNMGFSDGPGHPEVQEAMLYGRLRRTARLACNDASASWDGRRTL